MQVSLGVDMWARAHVVVLDLDSSDRTIEDIGIGIDIDGLGRASELDLNACLCGLDQLSWTGLVQEGGDSNFALGSDRRIGYQIYYAKDDSV